MDKDATWYGSRPLPRPHCVRRGPSSPPRKGHSSAPLSGACLLCDHGRPSQLLLSSCHNFQQVDNSSNITVYCGHYNRFVYILRQVKCANHSHWKSENSHCMLEYGLLVKYSQDTTAMIRNVRNVIYRLPHVHYDVSATQRRCNIYGLYFYGATCQHPREQLIMQSRRRHPRVVH